MRFVLYYPGPDPPPCGDQLAIRSTPGLRVLDEESSRLLLVEAPEAELRKTLTACDGWIIEPERPLQAR